jgi:hypothetical protein
VVAVAAIVLLSPKRKRARTDAASRSRPTRRRSVGENVRVAAYKLNEDAVRHAKQLIDARQYVLRSRWQNVQPRAREQNAFLKTHSWEEYAAWHLGLTEGAAEETKARHAFVYGAAAGLTRQGPPDIKEFRVHETILA